MILINGWRFFGCRSRSRSPGRLLLILVFLYRRISVYKVDSGQTFFRFMTLIFFSGAHLSFVLCGRPAAINPGNTLYVTGLSTRVSEKDVERHFSKEGKVLLLFSILFSESFLLH